MEREAWRFKQQQAILIALADGEIPVHLSDIDLNDFPFILHETEMPVHVFDNVAYRKPYRNSEGDSDHYEVFGTLAVTTEHLCFCERNGQAFRIEFCDVVSVSALDTGRLAVACDGTNQRTLFSVRDNEAEFAAKLIRLSSNWKPKPEKQPQMGLR